MASGFVATRRRGGMTRERKRDRGAHLRAPAAKQVFENTAPRRCGKGARRTICEMRARLYIGNGENYRGSFNCVSPRAQPGLSRFMREIARSKDSFFCGLHFYLGNCFRRKKGTELSILRRFVERGLLNSLKLMRSIRARRSKKV